MGPESRLELPGRGIPVAEPLLVARGQALWRSLSGGDLSARVAELAEALRGYGLEAGRRIAILAEAGPDGAVAVLAAAHARATAVVLDPALSGAALATALRERRVVQAIAGDDRFLGALLAVRPDLPDLEIVLVARPEPSGRPSPALRVEAACAAGAAALEQSPASVHPPIASDPALEIVSADAGEKRWSHAALILAAERLAGSLELSAKDVVFSRLPAVHADLAPLLAACLVRGARLVFDASGPFSISSLADEGATIAAIRAADLDELRRWILAEGKARSWFGRKLHAWALAQGRDPGRHPRVHRAADLLVLRGLRSSGGAGLRLIQVLGPPPTPEASAVTRAVGFAVAESPVNRE
jgi:long-subunit acyl-CoA synthetase (AMP-forming)